MISWKLHFEENFLRGEFKGMNLKGILFKWENLEKNNYQNCAVSWISTSSCPTFKKIPDDVLIERKAVRIDPDEDRSRVARI